MSIVNIEFMESQYGKEGAKDMLDLFANTLQDNLKSLQTAHEEQKWPVILIFTHKINGAASYCAATPLIEACSALESAIKIGNESTFEPLYQTVLNEISLVQKTLYTT